MKYKLYKNKVSNQISSVEKVGFNMSIPFDPDNTDAQQFAKWLKGGNVPEAAEEGGTVSPEWVAEIITKLLPNS